MYQGTWAGTLSSWEDESVRSAGLHWLSVRVTDRPGRGDLVKRLVEFALEHGGSVLVETDDAPGGPVMRGLGKDRLGIAEQTDQTFEQATAAVVPAADSLLARLRAAHDPAEEISIEFGVQLSAQTGAFIASAAVEANFRVSMTWRRSRGT